MNDVEVTTTLIARCGDPIEVDEEPVCHRFRRQVPATKAEATNLVQEDRLFLSGVVPNPTILHEYALAAPSGLRESDLVGYKLIGGDAVALSECDQA